MNTYDSNFTASAFVPGASRSPYYFAELVFVLNFLGGIAVWRPKFYKHWQTNKQIRLARREEAPGL